MLGSNLPERFSFSHFEFFGQTWLSHHHEYLRLILVGDVVAILPTSQREEMLLTREEVLLTSDEK
jgi:hypothetical protein